MGAAVRSPEPTPCGCTRETLPQEPLPRPLGGGVSQAQVPTQRGWATSAQAHPQRCPDVAA